VIPDPSSNLPDAFVDRLRRLFPDTAPVLATFSTNRATSFRVNTLRDSVESVIADLAAESIRPLPVPWFDKAFFVPPDERAGLLASKPYTEDRLYVQGLSSMVPVLALAPEPGERVLDLAAAPGSKTLQIACMMENVGEVAAVEVVKKRFFKLRDNLTRQRASCVQTYLRDGSTVWRHRPEYFDRVLLDAPCSSEGRFHTSNPVSYAFWSPRKIKEMANKQKRLIYSAFQSLRPGGVMVYSTCSFAPEENESIIHHLMRKFGEAVSAEPINLSIDALRPSIAEWMERRFTPGVSPARRIVPDETMGGFFVCLLRKNNSTI